MMKIYLIIFLLPGSTNPVKLLTKKLRLSKKLDARRQSKLKLSRQSIGIEVNNEKSKPDQQSVVNESSSSQETDETNSNKKQSQNQSLVIYDFSSSDSGSDCK